MPDDSSGQVLVSGGPHTAQTETNIYQARAFMQGGRPIPVQETQVRLHRDGRLSDDAGRGGHWTVEGSLILLHWDGAAKPETFCHYAPDVTEAYRDHLFAYGVMLAPQAIGFELPVAPVDDNPKESLKAHLAATHPDCRRIVSRASSDFFDIFPRQGRYLEVGVAYGNNAQRIRDALDPRELHLVDCWQAMEGASDAYSQANLDEAYAATLEKFGADPVAIFHKALSQEVLQDMAPGQFDMMYIDADHTEEACYRDLCNCEPLVKPDGFLCGHDYTRHANTADGAVARTNYGVIEAVDRFCRDHGWRLAYLTIEVHDWCFPSYVLTRT